MVLGSQNKVFWCLTEFLGRQFLVDPVFGTFASNNLSASPSASFEEPMIIIQPFFP